MKQTQIGKLKIPNIYGTIKIVQTEDRYNPYRIYYEYNELTDYGIQKRRRLLEKYADFRSVACYIKGLTFGERSIARNRNLSTASSVNVS